MNGDHPLNMPTRRFPRAVCLGQTDTFFPSNIKELFDRAKAICATCPEMHPCREAGMAEPYGIWGGLTPRERRRISRAAAGPQPRTPAPEGWLTAAALAGILDIAETTVRQHLTRMRFAPTRGIVAGRIISVWPPEVLDRIRARMRKDVA